MTAIDTATDLVRRLYEDGWYNVLTGLGTSRDRGSGTTFAGSGNLHPEICADLYHEDPIAGKACDAYPKEALRRGIQFSGAGADVARDLFRRHNLLSRIQEASAFGRAMGGTILVFGWAGASDTPAPAQSTLEWVEVYDRRRVTREYHTGIDPRHPLYGKTKSFYVTPLSGAAFRVHPSRTYEFGGAITAADEKHSNNGWDYSILTRIYHSLGLFNDAYLALGNMMGDAATPVLKVWGLIAAVAGKNKEAVATRAAMIDQGRSLARLLLLDADPQKNESFEKIATPFSGIPESIDRFINLVSAATEIPVAILMGQAPAGLNATGEMDLRTWYDRVESWREKEIVPCVRRICEVSAPGTAISFPSLWQPTAKERSENDKIEAEIDQIYIASQVVMPEEVAKLRVGRYPTIDLSLRGGAPEVGGEEKNLVLSPSDVASVATVREARASVGLPPFGTPDDDLTIPEYQAKYAATIATATAAASGEVTQPTVPDAPPSAS